MATPRLAAAVVLFRRTPSGPEVFWVRRSEAVPFMGGFHAFPGGAVDKADAGVPVRSASLGDEPRSALAAAIRECFEETGVLFAGNAAGVSREARAEWRRKGWVAAADYIGERRSSAFSGSYPVSASVPLNDPRVFDTTHAVSLSLGYQLR